jgi:hypothetical protein
MRHRVPAAVFRAAQPPALQQCRINCQCSVRRWRAGTTLRSPQSRAAPRWRLAWLSNPDRRPQLCMTGKGHSSFWTTFSIRCGQAW